MSVEKRAHRWEQMRQRERHVGESLTRKAVYVYRCVGTLDTCTYWTLARTGHLHVLDTYTYWTRVQLLSHAKTCPPRVTVCHRQRERLQYLTPPSRRNSHAHRFGWTATYRCSLRDQPIDGGGQSANSGPCTRHRPDTATSHCSSMMTAVFGGRDGGGD